MSQPTTPIEKAIRLLNNIDTNLRTVLKFDGDTLNVKSVSLLRECRAGLYLLKRQIKDEAIRLNPEDSQGSSESI